MGSLGLSWVLGFSWGVWVDCGCWWYEFMDGSEVIRGRRWIFYVDFHGAWNVLGKMDSEQKKKWKMKEDGV